MKKESASKILPLFFFWVLLSLFLLLGENFGLTKPIRGAVERLTVPTKTGVYRTWQGVLGILGSLGVLGDLEEMGEKIRSQEWEIASLVVENKSLEEENRALRRQLEAPLPPQMKFLPAKTAGLARYLTIDKGEEDGVALGMSVVLENILVGKVVSLTPKTARVLLPTDPEAKIAARTLRTAARGLVKGEFGTKMILGEVLQAERLEEEDLVVTTGEGYPRDLLIGKIGKVAKNEIEPFQQAEILPLLDYKKLVDVFVVR